jgi:primosomal protein N' (replication factor Y)
MNEAGANFARVLVPSRFLEPLVYAVPEDLKGTVTVGARALIPVGKRKLTGVVIELLTATALLETKEIIALLDDGPVLDEKIIELIHWLSSYYLASPGEVLNVVLPPGSRVKSEQWLRLMAENFAPADSLEKKVIDLLRQRNGIATVKYLARHLAETRLPRVLFRLEKIGVIKRRERLAGRRRRAASTADEQAKSETRPAVNLTAEQEMALRTIDERLETGGFGTFLLHGVTGSGKTEVYLRAMERNRSLGRRSLILIPEISLTPQLIDRVSARFPERVGILHSGLTGAQRWTHWRSIGRGEVDVIVGARSAVFAPIPDLGLIIVDEEHDSSYKQEDGLRYNARDVAVVRGKLSACAVILGSATPAVESYANGLEGRYRLLELSKRVYERPMPKVEVVDLRDPELRPKTRENTSSNNALDASLSLFSPPLARALGENFENRRQSLIFLNRRGFSSFLQCRSCGYVLRCTHCSVALTLHLKQRSLRCHHCDFRMPMKDTCPDCKNPTLRAGGAGTEQIEQAIKLLVPGARVARMDRDTTIKRGSQAQLIRSWERAEIDILVGTQMITKGHDVVGVTLVAAVLADLSLNLPDFRAAERTFQLLSQVSGRAGRGSDPGRVVVQTYTPDHYAIQHLLEHDYKAFFQAEIDFRRALNYPPFCRLIQLRLDGPKAAEVESQIRELATAMRRQLQAQQNPSSIEILGPAPAPIEKLRNRYRWQLLLKGKKVSALLEFAQNARRALTRSGATRLHVDVDPYSML